MNVQAFQPSVAAVESRKALPATPDHKRLVDQTRKWIGLTLFAPLLKQMHDDPFKSNLLDGGRGGQAFGSLYDQQMAERMSRGAGSKIVNGIVRRIEAHAAYAKQGKNMSNTDHEGADRLPGTRTRGIQINPALLNNRSIDTGTADVATDL